MFAATLLLTLGLGACSPSSEETTPAPTVAPAAAAPDTTTPQASANALTALTTADLRERARSALREQRIHSPAGDNAIEYYLALRMKSVEPDAPAESALMDLFPYALIGAEQAINDGEFAEAERLFEVMAQIDPEAPSLNRIRDAIGRGRTAVTDRERVETERTTRERIAAEQRVREAALAVAPTAAAPSPPVPVTPVPVAPAPEPVQAVPSPEPTATPVPTPELVATPMPTPAATPPPVRSVPPRAISTPQPPYPREAARSRVSGSVVVQFTIGTDGRVTEISVVRARPRGLFEDAVIDTVRTWRFEPPAEPMTVTRTFDFRM